MGFYILNIICDVVFSEGPLVSRLKVPGVCLSLTEHIRWSAELLEEDEKEALQKAPHGSQISNDHHKGHCFGTLENLPE